MNSKKIIDASQPCKVWCHLKGTELIRNKGLYPDGSPCGAEKYCVGGSCLVNFYSILENLNDPKILCD